MPNTLNPITAAFKSSHYYYMVMLDEEDCISYFNNKFNSQLSFCEGRLLNRSFSDFIFPEDYSKYRTLLKNTLAAKESNITIDLRKLTSDGIDFYWTRWEFSIDYLENGSHVAVGIGHKIQKPKDVHFELPVKIQDLHIKQEVLEGLMEDNLIGFWLWDITNKADQLSISLIQMLGYDLLLNVPDSAEIKWKKHVHPLDLHKVDEVLAIHFKSHGIRPFHCEFRILTQGNGEKWVVGYGKVVEWLECGTPAIMVGGFFDISEKKNSEDMLQKQHAFLKNLTFDQSHTMRAKLANIKGILEVLDPKSIDTEISHLVKMLKSEAEHLDMALKKSIARSVKMEYSTTK